MEKFRDTMIPEDIIEYERYVDIISGMGFRPIEIGEFYLQLEKLNDYNRNIIADCIVFHKALTIEGPHMSLLHSTMICMHKFAYVLAKNNPIIFDPSQVDNLFKQITNILVSTNTDSIKIIARNDHISIECLIDNDKPVGSPIDIEFNNAAILNYIITSDIKTIQSMVSTISSIRDVIREYEELINNLIKTEEDSIMKETNMKELQNIATKYSKYKTMLNDFDPSLEPKSIRKFKEQLGIIRSYLEYEKSHIVNIPLTGIIVTDAQRYHIDINLHRFVIMSIMDNPVTFDIDALNAVFDKLTNDPMLDKDKSKAEPTDTIEITTTKNMIKIRAFEEYEIPTTNGNAFLCISMKIPFVTYLLDNISKILTYLKKSDTAANLHLSREDREMLDKPAEEAADVSNSRATFTEYHRYKMMLNAFVCDVKGMDMFMAPMSENDFIQERDNIRECLACSNPIYFSIPMSGLSDQKAAIDTCFHRFAIMSTMDNPVSLDKDLLSEALEKFEAIHKSFESVDTAPGFVNITFDKDMVTVDYHMDPFIALHTWEIATTLSYQIMYIVKHLPCMCCFFDVIKKILQYLETHDCQEVYAEPTDTEPTPATDEPSDKYALGKWYVNAMKKYMDYETDYKQAQDEIDRIKRLFDSYMDSALISSGSTPDHLKYGWDKDNYVEAISNYVALKAINEGNLPERVIRELFDQIMILPVSAPIGSIVLRQSRSGKKSSISIYIKTSTCAETPIVLKVTCGTKKAVRLMTAISGLKTVSELYSVLNVILDGIESDKA